MAEMKTKVNDASVEDFLSGVAHAQRRADAFAVLKMMKAVTGKKPKMWGPTIVGFDRYHYTYESGREGDICMVGFSPRSQALTLYLMSGFPGREALLKKLGKHTTGKGCVYIRKLAEVDLGVLKTMVTESYRYVKAKYRPGA